MAEPRIVALVPARGGSVRIPRKNIRPLAGIPLLAYTIAAAKESGIFGMILVSTEDDEIARIAKQYGAVADRRRPEFAASDSPDIDWVRDLLIDPDGLRSCCEYHNLASDNTAFAILRPTSPFRSAETIRRAWAQFKPLTMVDSLRAMEPVRQHPCKMWRVPSSLDQAHSNCRCWEKNRTGISARETAHHSSPSQSLPPIYAQNASLEIAWTRTVTELDSISGERVMPFLTEGYEGFDLNTPEDWMLAETLIARGLAVLPDARPWPLPLTSGSLAMWTRRRMG